MAKTRFQWDEARNVANRRKHGIDFETTLRVFADPFAISEPDRIEDGETRWQTIGVVEGHLLLLVAHTDWDSDDESGHSIEIIRIISVRKAIARKDAAVKTKAGETVRHEVDLDALPPLTPRQRADLDALAQMPDERIDYSDQPSATFGAQALRGRFYKPVKQQITTRVDADVLAWLKSQGEGYQARINAILRREMLTSIETKRGA